MAALVQTYPQQSGTVTMLQTRPASASGMLPVPQSPGAQQYGGSQQRHSFYGTPNGLGPVGHRGSSAPIQPYAFTSTPSLNTGSQWQQFGNFRASSSPSVPTLQSFHPNNAAQGRYAASASMTHLPSGSSMGYSSRGSRDDSALPGTRRVAPTPRPQSAYMTGSATQVSFAQATPVRISPERYRRPAPRGADSSGPVQQGQPQGSAAPSGKGMAAVGHLYNSRVAAEPKVGTSRNKAAALAHRPNSYSPSAPGTAADDIQLHRQYAPQDAARIRRRSMPALDSADYPKPLTPHTFKQPEDGPRLEQLATPESSDKQGQTVRLAVADDGTAEPTMPSKDASSESLVPSHGSNSRPSSVSAASYLADPHALPNQAAASLPWSSVANTGFPLPQSAARDANPTGDPALSSGTPEQAAPGRDPAKSVNIPPRTSSDAVGRTGNASPLSKPVTMDADADAPAGEATPGDEPPASPSRPQATQPPELSPRSVESPAAQQLAAISRKGGKLKSKTSRLRRAFSFGSAAEFQKAGTSDEAGNRPASPGAGKLHKEPTADDLYDAEQARIAQKQEEAGIGNSIYAGARIFAGSTDNLSISSTASSASIMIRKMGRGMKKGTRSLVGLFRPKSVVGVPAADAQLPEVGQAEVSRITVEAERERVNVNADPHEHTGGGTGFPRLERNSIDAVNAPNVESERVGSSGTDSSTQRRNIVGGDRERAEVLAAVRKGILKKSTSRPPPHGRWTSPANDPADGSNSSSPSRGAGEENRAAFDVPGVPNITDSPASSAPSTPNDETQGHKRTGSVAIGSEDYFMTALRLRQDTKSAPNTPQGTLKRNATFSPRIIFYDTWPSGEYDRRGEIATCNRLTPMLAQQIKEELNSFKMVRTGRQPRLGARR